MIADSYARWAGVYDDAHMGFGPSEAQIDLLAELAGPGPALELGVGTGRVAVPLAARGVVVIGTDLSQAMLARAAAKADGLPLHPVVGDMVLPPHPRRFPLVYVVYNSLFQLRAQARQVACFRAVADVLQPGGAFCVECYVPDPTRFDRDQTVRVLSVDEYSVELEMTRHDPVGQLIDSAHVRLAGSDPRVLPIRTRYAWPSELDLMAALARLRRTERWEDWDRSPFTSASGKHVTVYQHDNR